MFADALIGIEHQYEIISNYKNNGSCSWMVKDDASNELFMYNDPKMTFGRYKVYRNLYSINEPYVPVKLSFPSSFSEFISDLIHDYSFPDTPIMFIELDHDEIRIVLQFYLSKSSPRTLSILSLLRNEEELMKRYRLLSTFMLSFSNGDEEESVVEWSHDPYWSKILLLDLKRKDFYLGIYQKHEITNHSYELTNDKFEAFLLELVIIILLILSCPKIFTISIAMLPWLLIESL